MSLAAEIGYYHQYSPPDDQYGSYTQTAKVSVKIVDAFTGLATPGNNCVVTYTITDEFNATNTFTKVVPGLEAVIYEGIIGKVVFGPNRKVLSSSSKSFKVISVTGGETTTPQPPPSQLIDLVAEIRIDQGESAPDAKDAQITVIATSSFLPIGYTLDGVISSSSPVFSNLSGGTHVVTITDASGVTIHKTVVIPTVSNLLVSDPSVKLPGGNISRWSAAFNPIVFTYQRRDYTVSGLEQNTADGKTRVLVKDIVLPTDITGSYIYLKTAACDGVFKVLGVINNNAIIIDLPFTFGANTVTERSGFININALKPYYQVRTRISFFDKITGRASTIESVNRPNNEGLVRADISNFLQSLLRARDENDYTAISFRDDNLSASYQIQYAPHWDDGTQDGHTSNYITIEKPYYVLYSARQLGDKHGGNLAAYVPFATTPNGAEKAKWITDFAEPAYSNGYPFDIGFIYSEDMVGRNIYAEFTQLDINRQPLPGGDSNSYLLNDDGSWLLNSDGSKYLIARQSIAKVNIPGQLGLNRLLIQGPFADNVYYLNVALKYDENGTTHNLTQTQTIRIDDAVDDQSVYLRWIGLSGSWNYYRFVYNQEVSLDVQNAVIIKNYVTDWQNQQGIDEVISKAAGQKVKVLAEDLSVADIKGLQSIKYSPKVQLLVNHNPVKWQTIVVNTATYAEYETRNGQAPFSITFSLPAINVQVQ